MKTYIYFDLLKAVFIMSGTICMLGISHVKCTSSVFFLNAYLCFCLHSVITSVYRT